MFIETNTPFNERLKTLLRKHHLKPIELADKLGVSRSTVSLWLSGKRNPSDESKYDICSLLDISYIELLHTDEEIALARLEYLFKKYNLDINEFDRFEELEKDLGMYFLSIVGKYRKMDDK